jgi:hypothetical protein
MNLLGTELVRDLVLLIQRAEADVACQVLVFGSADPDYFISHVDVTRISEYRDQAAKLTGESSIAMLFRYLSGSRLVTLAQIEGRVRGPADRQALADCDGIFCLGRERIVSTSNGSSSVGGRGHLSTPHELNWYIKNASRRRT